MISESRASRATRPLPNTRSPPCPKRDDVQFSFCLLVLQGVSLFHRFDSQQRVRVRHSRRPSSQHVRVSRIHVFQTENGKVFIGPAADSAVVSPLLRFDSFSRGFDTDRFLGVRCRQFCQCAPSTLSSVCVGRILHDEEKGEFLRSSIWTFVALFRIIFSYLNN